MLNQAIVAVGLVRTYSLGKVQVTALDSVSVTIEKGGFICIMGTSGSGKSTLLNLIGGLDRFDSGSIIVDGLEISKLDENELANYRREKIGGWLGRSYKNPNS